MLDKFCSGKARFLHKLTRKILESSETRSFPCRTWLLSTEITGIERGRFGLSIIKAKQKEMGRVEKYLERAAREALRSDCEHKHGACLVKGGKLLALGHNSRLRTRLQCGGFTLCSVHAEMKALYCFK
ncbi:hypothetical protein QOT17_004733 [Balamuthia mandrillaris]